MRKQKPESALPDLLKAIAEPRRIAILRLVRERELAAGEIASHFKSTRQAVSQHLRVLADSGLLELRREGTKRLYRVRTEAFGELRTFIDVFWNDRLAALKREVETAQGTRRGR